MFGQKKAAPVSNQASETNHWREFNKQLQHAADQAIAAQNMLIEALDLLVRSTPEDRPQVLGLVGDAMVLSHEAVGSYEGLKRVQDNFGGLFDEVDKNGPLQITL